jgi:hypothetical protein
MDWREWFAGYAADALSDDVAALAVRYAPSFLVAAPGTSETYRNDGRFLDWLRTVVAANRKAGMRSLEVVDLQELPLGDRHALVTVTWGARFARTGDRRTDFRISYVLADGSSPRILGYVSHEDQEQAMKAAGIAP